MRHAGPRAARIAAVTAATVIAVVLTQLVAPGSALGDGPSASPPFPPSPSPSSLSPSSPSPPAISLAELRQTYGPPVYRGLVQLRANKRAGEEHLVGDNTDPAGMHWTKSTNVALELLATLVAAEHGLLPPAEAREHVRAVLAALRRVDTHRGIFPEVLLIDAGLRAERRDGRVRYSSVDAAWLTLTLGVLESYFNASDPGLAESARRLLDAQDYAPFVGADGLLAGGIVVDPGSGAAVGGYGFSYADRNSEVRPLIVALVSMGKLPASSWDRLRYDWTTTEGVAVARGWHQSAFVEMTGSLWFDELALAPESLGLSHRNYVEATRRVAARLQHRLFGYAPTGSPSGGYTEYGLDAPHVVSPYGALLLALSGDGGALANAAAVLGALPRDGRPLPDALDPKTAQVACPLTRSLDQSLVFLALHAETLRALARRTAWYAAAEARLREIDRSARPPVGTPQPPLAPEKGHSFGGAHPPAHDGPPREPHDGPPRQPLERALATLRAVRRAALDAHATRGGRVQLAKSRVERANASATQAWLELAPELTLALRHESWHDATPPFARPSWWAEGELRLALSPVELSRAAAAERAAELGRVGVEQAEAATLDEALQGLLALYSAERRAAGFQRERGALDALRRGLPALAGAAPALVDAELAALDAALAGAEAERLAALTTLRELTRQPLEGSGFDASLSLDEARDVIRRELRQPRALELSSSEQRRARAAVALEQSRQRALEIGAAWYMPELRARVFASVPRVPAGGGGQWHVDRVTGEATAALSWRPEASPLVEAGDAAVERSEQALRAVEATRAESASLAQAELHAHARAWSERATSRAAAQLEADRIARFRRGELDVRAVLDAGRARRAESAASERLFAEALSAEARAAQVAPSLTASATDGTPIEQLQRSAPWLEADARARGARARSAAARAGSYRVGLELGVLGPFQQSLQPRGEGLSVQNTGTLVGGARAFGAQPVDDLNVVARASLELPLGDGDATAAIAEASAALAQSRFARQRLLAEHARARLALAYARARERLAERRLAFSTDQRAALAQMQAQGLLADPALSWHADLRLAAARDLAERERAASRRAQIRLNAQLGRALDAPPFEEEPDVLEAWLESSYFPEHGLRGYEGQARPALAALELRSAEARLEALREPPASVGLLLSTARSLETDASSWGFGVGFNLDPSAPLPRVLAAAERTGALSAELSAERAAVEREREGARREATSASVEHELASSHRERALDLMSDLMLSQAADLDQHESSKLRARAEIGERLMDAEGRQLLARERLALARLRLLELGEPPGSAPETSNGADRSGTTAPNGSAARLIDSDPDVLRADAAALAVEGEPSRPPLLAGLHPAGPALGVATFHRPAVAGGVERELQASVGVGLRYALDDAFGFTTRAPHEDALRLERAAARQNAELSASDALVALWLARERRRLLTREEASHRERLEAIVLPRYRAGHVGAALLADAQSLHSTTLAQLRHAELDERAQRADLARRGIDPSAPELDAELDALDTCSLLETNIDANAAHPGPAALDRRARVASADAWLSLAQLVGPLTLFVELAPRGSTSESVAGSRWDRRHAFLTSLLVPVTPAAIGDSLEASASADLRRNERETLARELQAALQTERARLQSSEATWSAATRRRDAAALALEDVARRYRAGSDRTSVDHWLSAREELFRAEHGEVDARAPVLASCARLESMARAAR